MSEPIYRIIDIREALNSAYLYGLDSVGVHNSELANVALDDLTIKLTAKFREAIAFAKMHPSEPVSKPTRDTKGNV